MPKKFSDQTIKIAELKSLLKKFRDARSWEQFHTPKNLASAISIESAELMEHFLWKTEKKSDAFLKDPANAQKVQEELADIVCYCLNLANVLDIDVSKAVKDKIDKNGKKYPVNKSKNNARKYTEF